MLPFSDVYTLYPIDCLIGLARRVNAKILIASTSEIYGDPEVHPQSETYWGHVNPIGIFFITILMFINQSISFGILSIIDMAKSYLMIC